MLQELHNNLNSVQLIFQACFSTTFHLVPSFNTALVMFCANMRWKQLANKTKHCIFFHRIFDMWIGIEPCNEKWHCVDGWISGFCGYLPSFGWNRPCWMTYTLSSSVRMGLLRPESWSIGTSLVVVDAFSITFSWALVCASTSWMSERREEEIWTLSTTSRRFWAVAHQLLTFS